MMTGIVLDLHALLPVTFVLSDSQASITLDFVVDTGFTGYLTLPQEVINSLGLSYLESIDAKLADDSSIRLPIHEAIIIWHGETYPVRVLATGKRPLLGTALLQDCEFVAQFVDNGIVTVEPV
jgi:clan AA aspartic protease